DFLGGLKSKPPKNTLFCVLVARWRQAPFLMSSGEVVATWSPVLARCRQRRPNFLLSSRYLSPCEARRQELCLTYVVMF
ncbi:hypothetical protein A2U01_0063231, partial [Trifolium medium]|nr:hypothetical protein [Trifolium medium]